MKKAPVSKNRVIFTVILLVALVASVWGIINRTMFPTSGKSDRTILLPYPAAPDYTLSEVFSVTVNGQPLDVQADNASGNETGGRHYVHFAFAGTANIQVTLKEDIKDFTLSPAGLNLSPAVEGRMLSFSLTVPRKLILWGVNGTEEKLFILADPDEG